MNPRSLLSALLVAAALVFSGCNYDSPLTPKPTQKINDKLLGDWISVDKDTGKEERLQVRQLDDSNYIVLMDGDAYRAYHSDYLGTAFVSVQDLQVGRAEHKFIYFTWQLSADNTQLTLRGISTEVVPETTKGRAAIQKAIKANLANPKLFTDAPTFTRPPAR